MGAVSAEVVRLLGASLAERTWATYGRAVERFLQFRQAAGLEPNWPAPTNHIAAFIASLSLEGLAPSSISTHTSAVAFVHKMQGWPDPTDSFCIRKLKEGIRRGGQKADSRRPISFELLGRLYNVLGAEETDSSFVNRFKFNHNDDIVLGQTKHKQGNKCVNKL